MKKIIPVLIAIVLIIIIGGVAFGSQIVEKYSYSQEKADLYEYFHIVKEEEVPIILQDVLIEQKAVMSDGVCYFDLDTVHTYFNERFYIDRQEQLLLYTTPTEVIRTELESSEYRVNGETADAGYRIAFARTAGEETVYYIAADFVKQYTNFSYEVFEEPCHMQIYTEWGERQAADITKNTAVRILGGVKSPILRQITAGETVTILEKMETWCKVKTEDAYIGYVENKFLENERIETQTPVTDYAVPEYTSLTKDHKISLGWHAIYATSGNGTLNEVAGNAGSLNVIAPTWFSVSDGMGGLRSFAEASYVKKAHEKGLEVWGVVDDFNYEDTAGTDVDVSAVLAATTTRTALIDNIMAEAAECGMDGVNIDFERINDARTGEDFVQFLRELSIRCRQAGLVFSIDNYVPYEFNARYNLKEQGAVADYVIIMAYDEHWAGSPEAGSVSSIDYVRYSIEKTSSYMDSRKIITALPFYTRLWKTVGTQVSSEAYPMTSVDKVLATYGMEKTWDETTSQNYAEITVGDTFYQMWVEDVQSIGVKLNVMQNYDLGGVAAWRLGYEPAAVWDMIGAYLQQ